MKLNKYGNFFISMSDCLCNIIISDSWVSSGHWALHKSIVANAYAFVSIETVRAFCHDKSEYPAKKFKDEKIETAACVSKLWVGGEATRFIFDAGAQHSFRFVLCGKELRTISEDFYKMFHLSRGDIWYTEGCYTPFAFRMNKSGSPLGIIMPGRIDDTVKSAMQTFKGLI